MSAFLGKVTSKGQITLPKQVRERLFIQTGDYLEMEVRGRELIIRTTSRDGSMLLRDYAAPYVAQADDLVKLRQRLSGLPVSLTDEVRAVREEKQ